MLQIRCKNNNVTKSFPEGCSLIDVYQDMAEEIGLPFPVVSAKVNNASQTRDLTSAEARRMEQIVEDNAVLDDLYGGKCSWYCGGMVDTVTATSALPPAGKNTYDGCNAHNFDYTSVWAEGADGPGIGEASQCL